MWELINDPTNWLSFVVGVVIGVGLAWGVFP